jgi:hypothetical protein
MTWIYFLYSYVLVPGLVLAYVLVGIWLVWRIASKPRLWIAKIGVAMLMAFLLLAVPGGDILIGRMKFSSLCQKEALVKVFRTVSLDAKFLSNDGTPKKQYVPGSSASKIADKYEMFFLDEQVFTWPRIEKSVVNIRDVERGDTLGQVINFRYWGGWVIQHLPGHHSAESCPELKGRTSLERLVFRSAG